MMLLKSCPKCLGAIVSDRDHYGKFVYCLNCGWQRDLHEALDTVARTAGPAPPSAKAGGPVRPGPKSFVTLTTGSRQA